MNSTKLIKERQGINTPSLTPTVVPRLKKGKVFRTSKEERSYHRDLISRIKALSIFLSLDEEGFENLKLLGDDVREIWVRSVGVSEVYLVLAENETDNRFNKSEYGKATSGIIQHLGINYSIQNITELYEDSADE